MGIYVANSPRAKPIISGRGTSPTSPVGGYYKPMAPQDSVVIGGVGAGTSGRTGVIDGGSTVIGNAAVGFVGQEK